MPSKQLANYLRTYRKRSYLSQDEVAYVLGCRSGSKVSRYENDLRLPTPETVFAYEVLFHALARRLFGGRYAATERKTLGRMRLLERRLSRERSNPVNDRKVELLRELVAAQKSQMSNR